MNIVHTPLKVLLEGTRSKQFSQGQLILYAGDQPTEALIITSGIIKVYDIDDKGQEKILQIIKGPAIIPMECLFTVPLPISWHYGALTAVTACVFSPDELDALTAQNPELSSYIIDWLAVQSHELLVRVDSKSKSDAREKILAVLRFFEVYYTGPTRRGWKRVAFPITHQLIADIAGIARESASVQLGQLQKDKIIRARRPFIEINIQNLYADTFQTGS